MKACSTASGGVFFVPDEIERQVRSISYTDLCGEEAACNEKIPSVLIKQKDTQKLTIKSQVNVA